MYEQWINWDRIKGKRDDEIDEYIGELRFKLATARGALIGVSCSIKDKDDRKEIERVIKETADN